MKRIRENAVDYGVIILGTFILALGINCFLVPVKISTGGVSGVATVVYYFLKIPLSVTTLVINMVLFVFGYRTLEKAAVFKTVLGILLLSFFLQVTEFFPSYDEDMLVASVFGGILVGFGVGLTVLKDASTGGSDFLALALHKLIPHVSVASFILLIDCAVIVASGAAFRNYTIMFYSVISLYISSKVTDAILVHGDYAKSVYIISDSADQIAGEIMEDMERGVTGIYSKGMYNNEDRMMIMCVVRNKEVPQIMKKVKHTDPNAFVIISEIREVRGEGFKEV